MILKPVIIHLSTNNSFLSTLTTVITYMMMTIIITTIQQLKVVEVFLFLVLINWNQNKMKMTDENALDYGITKRRIISSNTGNGNEHKNSSHHQHKTHHNQKKTPQRQEEVY